MLSQEAPSVPAPGGGGPASPEARPTRLRRLARWALDHPLVAVAIVAVAARVLLAVGVAIAHHGTLFGDDERYLRMARQAADGDTSSWDAYLHLLYRRTGSLLWPVTGLFEVFGGVAIIAQLFVAALGTGTAVLTTKLGLEFLGRPAALFAGIAVALLPSQILWSSLVMKDAVVWCLLAGIAVTFVASWRARGWRLLACWAGIVAMLTALGFLRLHTLEIALVALLLASVVAPAAGRLPRVAAAAAVLLLLPVTFGMGVAGISFLRNTGSLTERRALNAVDADTAVVKPATGAPQTSNGTLAAPASDDPGTSTVSYLPEGLTVILLRPFPWEIGSGGSTGVRLAGAETVLWYPLLAIAIVGLVAVRRRLAVLAFPLLAGAATAVMYGLSEGNVGTAYRHRGEFVWVVALLAAAGAERIARALAGRRAVDARGYSLAS